MENQGQEKWQVIDRNPGKFEGEPEYVKAFWEVMMDGGADETIYEGDHPHEVFVLSDEDRMKYGFDEEDYALVLWESDQGFVNHEVISKAGLNAFRTHCEKFNEENDDETL